MARRVFVLGAHPSNGFSMRRYTALLEQAYSELGYDVSTMRPTGRFSEKVRSGPIRKFLIYIEKLVIFPVALWSIPRGAHVHVGDHSDAIWLLHPNLRKRRALVTCHDLFAIQAASGNMPEYYPKLSGRIYQRLIDKGIKKSGRLVSVSDCTKTEVLKHYGGIPTHVVRNPLDDSFAGGTPSSSEKYVLVVGAVDWRKRRDVAIRAWMRLQEHEERTMPLVLVGPELTEAEKRVLDGAHFEASHVRVLSNITDQELIEVYSRAAYLIVASKYEGFAWPIIEANALGVPALCADEPILRETGSGNVFFNSQLERNDWNSILGALASARHSESLRRRARSFSKDRFVSELAAVVRIHGLEAG